MLMTVAPSSMAIEHTSAVNSRSARVASIGENSTSSTSDLAWATAARAWPLTSSRVDCSWCVMCMSLVEMNVWIRGRAASCTAPKAASTSATCARASPAMIGPSTWRAMAWTASKSPGLVIGKPASMTSTPRRASWWAISSFSWVLSEIPGDCSPSRSVVSKICTRSMSLLVLGLWLFSVEFAALAAATHQLPLAGEEQEKGEAEGRPHLAPRLPRARVTSTDNAASVLQMLKRTCIAIAAAAVALAASAPGASAGGCQALQSLPPTTPDVVGLTLTPNPVVAGQTVQAHFSLDKPVPFEIPYFITKNGFNGITLSTTCIRMRPGDTGGNFTITTTTSIPTLPNFAEIMVSFTPLFSVLTPGQNWVDLQILPPSSPKPPPPPPPPPPPGS